MNIRSEKLLFPNGRGEELAARLELPEGEPRAFAVFAHCFTCSKDVAAAGRISRALGREGLAVLRFDFTGLGNSEGDFANESFSSNVEDLVAAASYLREHHQAPRLLVGHSLGGAAVLAAAGEVDEVRAVATIGAPSDPGHVAGLFGDDLDLIEREGSALVRLGGRELRIRKSFVEDLRTQTLEERLGELDAALLILHSPTDEVVGIDHARRLFEAARHPKSFLSLDGADHLVSRRPDSEYVAKVLSAWASRYLFDQQDGPAAPGRSAAPSVQSAQKAPEIPASGEALPEGVVRVIGESGSLTQRVQAGRHTLLADEPVSLGGVDQGPNPYDLLLAALGACTSMTLRLYADHKGWPLEQVSVTLRHAKIHAKDCADCETSEGKVDRIERVLRVAGELDGAQRARLLEIANRCPVHRTLNSEVTIPTRMAEVGEAES